MVNEGLILPKDFRELVKTCCSLYEKNRDKMNSESIRKKRVKLSSYAEAFHKECGTLTPSVQKKIEDLKSGKSLVLMTAHQPNFFAYSGVYRKATLNFVLAQTLERLLKVPVVSFFGIADQDFTDDRWVRSCQLPAAWRSGGIYSIDVKLPEKMMLNRIARPDWDVLEKWKNSIETWLDETLSSVKRLCRVVGFSEIPSSVLLKLHENFESFWSVVEGCARSSDKYSDFNAFVMSKVVNEVWGYDTIFARFSECQQVFAEDFRYLLSRFGDYSELLIEAKKIPCGEEVGGDVSDQEPCLAPFWYHCGCGSKAKLFLTKEDGRLIGEGNCVRCEEKYELGFGSEKDPDISNVASSISARAVAMALVFFNGLRPLCYVGGVGGLRYLLEAQHVAGGLSVPFPAVVVWRPRDKYLGVGQLEAQLEQRRVCSGLGADGIDVAKAVLESHVSEIREYLGELEASATRIAEELKEHPYDEQLKGQMRDASISRSKFMKSSDLSVVTHELKVLENVLTVSDLVPSIIDYAVNVGLKETSVQWVHYLNEKGNFCSDVKLESALDLDTNLKTIL